MVPSEGAATMKLITHTQVSVDGVSIVSLKPAFSRRVYAIWRTLASERPAIAVTVSAIHDVATDLSASLPAHAASVGKSRARRSEE